MTSDHDSEQPTGHRTQHQPSPATNGLGCDHTKTQPQAPIRAAFDETKFPLPGRRPGR